MNKKIISFALVISMVFLTGCNNDGNTGSSQKGSENSVMKSLSEIRSETENIADFDSRFDNLNLSNTRFYVPDVDKIEDFSIVFDASIDEKEKLLLDTAEWMMNEPADENDLIYYSYEYEYISYAECKDSPKRDENYGLFCRNDKLNSGINLGGSYIYIANNAVDELVSTSVNTPRFINGQEPIEEYDLLAGGSVEKSFELQDGEIKVSDAVDFLKSDFESSPLCIDGLNVFPRRAGVYTVGEKTGIHADFFFEYNGVMLDYHIYTKDLESDEYNNSLSRTGINFDSAMVWKNQTDQLYGVPVCAKLKPTGESFDEFVSLEHFLSMTSEKLTGKSEFSIDSVELLYGVNYIFPEGYSSLPFEEKVRAHMPGYKAHPIWVAYLSHTGIQESEQMCVTADAVTGELKLYASYKF